MVGVAGGEPASVDVDLVVDELAVLLELSELGGHGGAVGLHQGKSFLLVAVPGGYELGVASDGLDGHAGTTETVEAAALFILIGAQPRTEWLTTTLLRDDHGFLLTGRDLLQDGQPLPDWPLDRPPLPLETSLPGVFAAGDVRHRSVKRVASAVGEGSIGIQLVHDYLGQP